MSRKQKIIVVLLLPILVTLLWFLKSGPDPAERTKPTTYSTAPKGAKALFLLLKELNVPVERFREKPSKLKDRGTLVIYEPLERLVSGKEFSDLKHWVGRGSNLVVVYGLSFPWIDDDDEITETKDGRGFKSRFGLGDLQLEAKRFKNARRTTLSVAVENLKEPLEISVSNRIRWETPKSDWEVMVKDEKGPILVRKKIGKGFIYALSDPTIFSNQYLRKEQNARFALALLLAKNSPPKVLFDEYHHGFSMEDGLAEMVSSSVFLWVFLQLLVGLALFFYSRRASHGGRFRSLDPPAGRSSTEYVMSMANVSGIFRKPVLWLWRQS